jgi:hypothetical protein
LKPEKGSFIEDQGVEEGKLLRLLFQPNTSCHVGVLSEPPTKTTWFLRAL